MVHYQDDLFRIKIKQHSIGGSFETAPQGDKGRDYELALEFIKRRFLKAAGRRKQSVRIFVTNATDCDQVKHVTGAVLSQYSRQALYNSGYMHNA